MTLLIASLVALLLGPLAHRAVRHSKAGLSLLDGFLVVSVAGLVLFRVVPEAVAGGGWWALLFCLLGLLGPSMLERLFRDAARQTHNAAMLLALVGVTFHATFDGAALNLSAVSERGGGMLPLAVVLHRFPVGLTIWWLLRPSGVRVAGGVLTLMSVATCVGYFGGPSLLAALDGQALSWFEALVAGSLLHVILHRYPIDHRDETKYRIYDGLGAVVGLAFLVTAIVRESGHPAHQAQHAHGSLGAMSRIVDTFLSLALTSAGPLLLAYLLAGAMAVFLAPSTVAWMRGKTHWGQALRGMAIGLPFPVCSCGVVPLYRTLVRRGVPTSAAMAFLIATPELGLDAVLLSIPLLGGGMTLARVLAAALVAFLVGWWVGRMVPAAVPDESHCCHDALDAQRSTGGKLKESLKAGFGEVVEHTGSWILIGLAIAAMIEPILQVEWLSRMPTGFDVAIMALLGVPTYVCASGATPLVAVLLYAGVSPGAALAFLLTGPATNISTAGVLSRLHGVRAAAIFAVTMISLAIAAGVTVNLLAPGIGGTAVGVHSHEHAAWWQWASLYVLAAVFLAALLRLGARKFFFENLMPDPQPMGGHGHG